MKRLLVTFYFICFAMFIFAKEIRGTVRDKDTLEPLIGASVLVSGTNNGTITDFDGNFSIEVSDKSVLVISYVSYKTINVSVENLKNNFVDVLLEPDNEQLDEVMVVARKNNETAVALLKERQKSSIPIENIGSKDLSVKGISNVQEGVKKITGISVASAGQIIVRGLGDRYSITTLNGMPIASPNPDNKLIPLDLFPTSTVKNITVSKVYDASSFADYSGAHIDIATKDHSGEDFFNVSVSASGYANTIGRNFYEMNRQGTLFTKTGLDKNAKILDSKSFSDYSMKNDVFRTSFDVERRKALPAFGGNASWGHNFDFANNNKLSVLASLSLSNDLSSMNNAFVKTLEASNGTVLSNFDYDAYTNELKIAGLASVIYSFREQDRIGYTMFYARNAVNEYMTRTGFDDDGHNLVGINDVLHIYTLQNHQLDGIHYIGDNWNINWKASYSDTESDEPDRRQVMFELMDNGSLTLFKRNRQETMRYFGELGESEFVGSLTAEYNYGKNNKLNIGVAYKGKNRDYLGIRYYYNLKNYNPVISDIYSMGEIINQSVIGDGTISLDRKKQPKDTYDAANKIIAGFVTTDYYPVEALLLNVGVRYEYSRQFVNYFTDQSVASRRDLNKHDIFPALNVRYLFKDRNNFRLSFSRTVTRPSFIEMAPFAYQESYGSAQIRGNENLKNGYNYNIDLRYEIINTNGDMLSVTGYYKYLESPIERTQRLAGGATEHSFNNAEDGLAAGVEVEIRKTLINSLVIGANASYMYTNVVLSEGGAYTNTTRALQGASPYLVNADITYSPELKNGQRVNIALLYNLQGPRIQSVGVSGLGDVTQLPLHTLNFVAGYKINEHFNISIKANDLLNRDVVFEQDIPQTGGKMEVERFKTGTNFEIGFTYNL